MKAGLIGPSYVQRSLPFDAQRTVNLFPVLDEMGKEPASLYGTPGKELFATAGLGPGRGGFSASNGRAFFVSGSGLFEVFANGTTTLRGSLENSSGLVTIDENGLELAICDGFNLYLLTYATDVFAKVVDADLPSAATVTFLDGYFIVNRPDTGIFQISGLYDGASWAALDFATAESSPDQLLRVLNVLGQLWLLGDSTTEIWSNTGTGGFPFARISGAKLETGIGAAYSAIALDNSVFWVSRDKNGFGIVYRADGFSPQRITTEAIEKRIQEAPSLETLRTYSYQEEGHTFFVLTGGGMETSLCYDLTTQLWHERAYLNEFGNYELDLGAFGIYAFNKQLVISRINGKIYEQSLNFYSDDGEEIARERTFTHLQDENQRVQYRNLTVGFETGSAEQGTDPQAVLSVSRDGGRTYSGGIQKSLGLTGQYLKRVDWQRLGQARQMTFRVRVTSPTKVAITGAYFNTKD